MAERAPLTEPSSIDRLSINHATTRRWSLPEAIEGCARLGVRAVGLWPQDVKGFGVARTRRLLHQHAMRVSSYCCGELFTARTGPDLAKQVARNRILVEEAAMLEAECIVCVTGGLTDGDRDLGGARKRALEGFYELAPLARQANLAIGVEPIHPMRAADVCCITTLAEANAVCDALGPGAGIVVDAYHVWWDPNLDRELERARGRIVGVHLSDWLRSWDDNKAGRGMMGDGVIDIRTLTRSIDRIGYAGFHEVELVSGVWGARDPIDVVRTCIERYRSCCV